MGDVVITLVCVAILVGFVLAGIGNVKEYDRSHAERKDHWM